MMKNIEQYFKQKTENLSFIELKPDSNVVINGYKIKPQMPLPIVIDELINEIKDKRAQEELNLSSITRGMIYTLGVDPEFKYCKEYRKILFKYNEEIEEYILYSGIKLIENGNLEDGMIYFRALVNLNTENLLGLFNYSLALEKSANELFKNKNVKEGNVFLTESTSCFEELIDKDASFSPAYYKLGYHYLNTKQFKKAQIMWEKFIEFDDDDDESLSEIKDNLIKIQDDVDYEEGYTEIFRGNPNNGLQKLLPLKKKYKDWWNLLFMIGLGYRQLGRFLEAKTEFENVLAIMPDQVDTLNELGLCLSYIGKNEEAIEKFTKAIEKKPKDYEILCNRGMTYLQMNETEKAIEDIENAYNMNPHDEITISCKKEIEHLIDRA